MADGTTQLVHTLSAHSARGFVHHAVRVASFPVVAWEQRALVWNFFRRELMSRFHGSYLGAFWVLVQPMFMFAVYYVIFGLFMGPRSAVDPLAPDPRFPFYLFSGYILFHGFSEGTGGALRSIVGNNNLVKKVVFPAELLPLSPVLSAMVVYLIGCALCIVVGLAMGQVELGWRMLLWPVVVVQLLALSTGVGLLLASSFVFMRDLQQLWSIVTTAMFFLSPIFWYPELVAQKAGAAVIEAYPFVSPVFSLLMAQRAVFGIADEIQVGTLGGHLAIATAFSLGFLVLGYGVFMSQKHKFADLV